MIPLPEESEPRREITPGFAVLLTFVVGYLQLALGLLFIAFESYVGAPTRGITTILAFGIGFALAVPRIAPPPGFQLGFVRAPRAAWTALPLLLFSILLVSEVDNVMQQFFPMPEEIQSAQPARDFANDLSLFVVVVLVLPVVQEVFFRGLLQPHMVQRFGAWRGIAFVALLNALTFFVLNPWSLGPIFATGLLMGVLRQSSHSVWPCLILHGLFGLITYAASHGMFGIPGFDDTTAAHTPVEWILTAVILTALGLRLCQRAAQAEPPAPPEPPEGSAPFL